MAFDDLDTWRVIYSQFVVADSEYAIHFALLSTMIQMLRTAKKFVLELLKTKKTVPSLRDFA